jgi:hypothetical protein
LGCERATDWLVSNYFCCSFFIQRRRKNWNLKLKLRGIEKKSHISIEGKEKRRSTFEKKKKSSYTTRRG